MRAVKCKHNILSFINTLETKLYDLVEANGVLDISTLGERDQHMVEEMYKKNILKKIVKDGRIGYSTYQQKQIL